MKKIVFVLLFMLTAGLAAQAQVVLGIKAGVSSSNVDLDNMKGTITQFKDEESITGYHLGAFTRFKAGPLFLQPEGVFASSGGKVKITRTQNNGAQVETTEEFKFNRLDVPVLLGLSFLKIARVQAGPVASVLVNGKLGDQTIEEYLDKSDFGWQAGLGFDIGKLTADLRYERVKREYTNQGDSYDVGNQQVILSLGYKLFGE